MFCWKCGTEILRQSIHRQDLCTKCQSPLHACYNCRFYDKNAWKACHEPQAERVERKEVANFCEYFEQSKEKPEVSVEREDQARRKLEELFNKKKS